MCLVPTKQYRKFAMTRKNKTLLNSKYLPRAFSISRVLLFIALVMFSFYFVVYVLYTINLMQFPFDYDQGEGYELVDVVMLSEGQLPYQDAETYPFYGSIYPPVYHMMLVPFMWLFGPVYWYGRLISFLTTVVAAVAIGYAVYTEGNRTKQARFVAVLAGLAFLSSNVIYHIGPLFRQHIPMFMFETLAVVILARANEIGDQKTRRRRMLWGFGLLILAGYTKQLAAFTAIAALIFIFIRNPRRAIVWGSGFTAVGVGIFAWLNIASKGHWWTQTITANVLAYMPDQADGLLRLFVDLHGWLLIPAVLLVIYELYFDRISIYSMWFIVGVPFSAYSAGTWGAGDSYYGTSIAAVCVLSGIFIARTLNREWTFRNNYLSHLIIDPLRKFAPQTTLVMIVIVPMFYVAYGRTVLHMPTEGAVFDQVADILGIEANAHGTFYDSAGRITGGYADIGHFTTQEDIEGGNEIVALINDLPEDAQIISEEAAFPLLTGKDVVTNSGLLNPLGKVGAYDSTELVQMIENHEFGLVILRAQFFPMEVNVAIATYYEHSTTIEMNGFDYFIMRPAVD